MSFDKALLSAMDPVETFKAAFGLDPHPWQLAYLRSTAPTAVLKSRQIGATAAAAAAAIHQAVYNRNHTVVVVAPGLRQSGEIVVRARAGLNELGERMIADSASLLRLRNGSRIASLPGTQTSVRGWVADLLVLDEAAFIPEETWIAARALVAATGGRTIVQSTPWDAAGPFHALVTGDDPGWLRLSVPASEVPSISSAFLDSERAALGPEVYAREYECEFGAVGASLFSIERIQSLILPSEAA
jgi:hypothetical protein